MTHLRLFITQCLLLATLHVCAVGNDTIDVVRTNWYGYVPYGKSLLADVHPNFPRVDICSATNSPVYDFGDSGTKQRAFFQGVIGMDIPIWNGNFANGRFGLSVTDALSVTIWMDFFERTTAPVVNTDYRIGAPTATFIHRINDVESGRFVRNYSIAFTPLKHESTHVGDEHQIRRIDQDYALRRVNVSYNYAELALTLNEPEHKRASYHTLRAGGMLLLAPHAGWYTVIEEAGDGPASLAHPRLSPWEAYLQYQYQTKTTRRGIQGVASCEIRNRAVYGYDLALLHGETDKGREDSRRFTLNTFVGFRVHSKHYQGYFSTKSFGLRYYNGNCPYGMFRSIKDYQSIGLSVIMQ